MSITVESMRLQQHLASSFNLRAWPVRRCRTAMRSSGDRAPLCRRQSIRHDIEFTPTRLAASDGNHAARSGSRLVAVDRRVGSSGEDQPRKSAQGGY